MIHFFPYGETTLYSKETQNHKQAFQKLQQHVRYLRETKTKYNASYPFQIKHPSTAISNKTAPVAHYTPHTIFGQCPVASPKTRCCNLWTIDVIKGCGFHCSYCTIQSFYDPNEVTIVANLEERLSNIELDPKKRYHIGSGQSSDSLLIGNRDGILEAQLSFAKEHSNVLFELKTKSNAVSYLLTHPVPPNVIVTWSLNPQIIIDNEEHYTASLEQRLSAARQIANRGIQIGFHFHPMIYYQNWNTDYKTIAKKIMTNFSPEEITYISFGTLTFIKPAIKAIRQKQHPTKVLQIPLEPIHGKFSYSEAIKEEMFSALYQTFSEWHSSVFFYLCMENASLWESVFGFSYENNEEFEQALLDVGLSKR